MAHALQGILSLLASRARASPPSLIGGANRTDFAERVAETPGYQQLLRRSVGQIVRASSRCEIWACTAGMHCGHGLPPVVMQRTLNPKP